MKGYFVYFYYNSADELLYIGKAVDVGVRWNGHNEPWKKEVYKIGVREYPDHASMDIFEHYYIAKLQTRYNVALLHHGKTEMEIQDPSPLTLYNRKEFIEKFVNPCKPIHRPKPVLYQTVQESLEAKGFTVVHAKRINLFDKTLLELDLDKTIFMFENVCLSFNASRSNKSDKIYPYPVANRRVKALCCILGQSIIMPDGWICGTITTDPSEFREMLIDALDASCISLDFVKRYKNGREYFGAVHCVNYISSAQIGKRDNNTYFYQMELSRCAQDILVSQKEFWIDLSNLTKQE